MENTLSRISNAANKPPQNWSVLLVAEAQIQSVFFLTVPPQRDGCRSPEKTIAAGGKSH